MTPFRRMQAHPIFACRFVHVVHIVSGHETAYEDRSRDPIFVRFSKNGRTGRIKKWGSEKFGTYFVFAGQKKRNSFGSFERALTYLEHEFSKIDSDAANSLALHPLNSDVRTYSELEQLLRLEGGGATLREAVTFFLANHRGKRFQPAAFDDCSTAFLKAQRAKNVSAGQIETLAKHYRRFSSSFGQRSVHEITALEVETRLAAYPKNRAAR